MQIIADVGGIPGKDCRGFCKYCYFRKVKGNDPLGCRYCSPGKVGCEKCTTGVRETKNEFIPPFMVVNSVQNSLMMGNYLENDLKVNISGGGDVSCYPYLQEVTSALNQWNLPIHLGYTSGKGIDNSKTAEDLMSQGVNEVTFTVFSTDPGLRKEWVGDPNPEEALKALKLFCESCEVHAASVIVPGVNDGEKLFETCSKLEEWGAKAFILMRFANFRNQGLILGNEPILEGVEPHSLNQFEELVRRVNDEFNLRVTGTPLCDPENDTPFAISKDKNKEYLDILSEIKSEATILTSKTAAPFIEKIIRNIGADDFVNVVAVDQDIGCLITQQDLENLDLKELKETVIFPGRAFVHNKMAEKVLTRDGVDRIVMRGPEKLSVDGEMSGTLTKEQVLKKELIAFEDLIEYINFFGVRKNK
ncbi:methyl coenzyme M reductase-arginine methyltransferase Mmp10 [Methanobacterium paludis]|uniref:Methanogenesis marker protein 10 n=1 Tax=Methanobacterium paludis (strain DSM 25820 / JCM 18151 / SWAN1) TaxID=868131 RepID=F6D2D8_METPW|nr:methyl coenzyme M reductase-arginine methyltransferase Mmp10 [Methanobacterium paludis]AEG19070.1 methanogenesis marker protein 10 [Methanobacterium paludis]